MGTLVSGAFNTINWGGDTYFNKIEFDKEGGSSYVLMGTSQMLSVPYALHAKTADNGFSGNYDDLTNKPNIPTIPINVSSFTNDAQYLTTEQQALRLGHDTIYLTSGGFVKIPAGFSGNYNDLTNKPNIPTISTNVSSFTNDAHYLTTEQQALRLGHDTIYLTNGGFVKTPAGFNGNYNDLTNKPTIPVIPSIPAKTSDLTNDAGFITSYTETDPNFNSSVAKHINSGDTVKWNSKSNFTGSYSDLTGKPVLFGGSYSDLTNQPTLFGGSYNDLSGKPSLFTGNYSDLLGKPTLFTGSYDDLTNKPVLFTGSYTDLTNKPILSTVAGTGSFSDLVNTPVFFSGAYNDLTGKPTLFSGSYTDLWNKPTISTVGTTGVYSDLTGKPTLSTVAGTGNYNYLLNAPILFSGSYSDLTNKPTISIAGATGVYSDLTGKPTLFTGSYTDLSNKPTFSTVAGTGNYSDLLNPPILFSGSYGDLSNKPTLFSGSYSDLTNKPTISTVGTTGVYSDLTGKPTLFTGSYTDLTNKPTNVSAFANDAKYLTSEKDSSVTNELQALSIRHDTIFLTNGGYVKLPHSTSDKTYLVLAGNITDAQAAQKIHDEAGSNTQFIWILNTTQLTTVDLTGITQLVELVVRSNNLLSSIAFPMLTDVWSQNQFSNNPALTSISFPSLTYSSQLNISSNNALVSVDIPTLAITQGIDIDQNHLLFSISISALQKIGDNFYLNDNALTSAKINSILARLVNINPSVTGQYINLSNQTPAAPPTGQGITDKATLIANGNSVYTDAPPVPVQQRLTNGETPKHIYDSGIILDSLYGKTYQGGLIAYLNTSDGTGLIASSTDQTGGGPFWGGGLPGSTGTAIGTGQANTTAIVIALGGGGLYGAKTCDELSLNGYDDWFLPSKDELYQLYLNLKLNGLGGFPVNGFYWSSSVFSSSDFWVVHINNGSFNNFRPPDLS